MLNLIVWIKTYYLYDVRYGTSVLTKHGVDFYSNPLIIPLDGYIFDWFIIYLCWDFFIIQTTNQSLIGIPRRWVNKLDCKIKKIRKIKSDAKKQTSKDGLQKQQYLIRKNIFRMARISIHHGGGMF